jgi:hypothetical protein
LEILMAKYEAGNQTRYMYTFYGTAPIFQYCRSYGEAVSWAETYANSVSFTGGLKWWGVAK